MSVPRPDPTTLPTYDLRALEQPLDRFALWWADVQADTRLEEPAAMTLATVGADGRPSARVVLLRAFDARGFVFFTNFESRKGTELDATPSAALCFHWIPRHWQVRVEGHASRVDDAEADVYFQSRPRDSRLSAWASHQSRQMDAPEALEAALQTYAERYPGESHIPRPPFWGGFRVVPRVIEFWQEGPFRRHRRDRYEATPSGWRHTLLWP